jgi:hypothetical protein
MKYPDFCWLCFEEIEPNEFGFVNHIRSLKHNLMIGIDKPAS